MRLPRTRKERMMSKLVMYRGWPIFIEDDKRAHVVEGVFDGAQVLFTGSVKECEDWIDEFRANNIDHDLDDKEVDLL